MDRTVSITCGALLLAGCGPRIVALDIDAGWFACERRRECTILEDPRCTLMPINRRYADSFVAWVRRNRAEQIKGTPCVRNAIRYEAVCEDTRCSSNLVRPALTAARPRPAR